MAHVLTYKYAKRIPQICFQIPPYQILIILQCHIYVQALGIQIQIPSFLNISLKYLQVKILNKNV